METPTGFKPLTSSTTISITPSQPLNSNTMIAGPHNATGKQHQQPPPLQRALFEQAPFRRPSNLPGIPAPVPVSMSTQPSPSESFLGVPTPTSSIESSQNPQTMPTFYPHFSGVDNLILAAKIQASSKDTTPTCNAIDNSNFNLIYSNPSITAPYSNYVTAYYQQQLLQQQQQRQQQQHHQMQQIHQVQQQQMRDTVVFTPMTSRDSQPMSSYDHQPKQPTPKNKHELELYELLKQANLLEYFGKFIKFGGDDVQQLAEADEQEFVEIMELVEMNHKPLHMRRMQKALNKWRQDTEESLEASENFKKPDALNDSGFYVNKVAQEYLSQHNTSLRSTSSLNDSLAPTSTGVARSLFPKESNNFNNNNSTISESPQQQYNTPLEVIKNAPKKPRLMDNIKPSDLTKGIQIDDNGPLGSTPKKVKPHNKHFSGSASSPASGYSPDYCPYSPTYSDISVDDGPVMEVSEPIKDPVKKLTGTSKRKRSMKKPSVATDLSRY